MNTSFNVRGEPIVCTPADALRCFMNTAMDELYIGGFRLLKGEQKNANAYRSAMADAGMRFSSKALGRWSRHTGGPGNPAGPNPCRRT